jgi:MoaA/NifB/PqqE/SkfB family radical SAM enzyme
MHGTANPENRVFESRPLLQNNMNQNSLHVELTNRCTLLCPSCPRTLHNKIKKIDKNDLNVNDFYNFLDCTGGSDIKTLVLCGDYGDSIYYPHLIDFIQKFRTTKNFAITTNGSRQTENFWYKLSENLTADDKITFAIDGLESENLLYRKNSDWDSVLKGLEIISRSSAKLEIQTIVFNFNYNKLDQLKQFADSFGAEHRVMKSHRFDGAPEIVPPVEELIETQFLYKAEYNSDTPIQINPGCLREKVVTCEGYFFPCDWIRNPFTFYKSELHKQRQRWIDRLNINNINYDAGLEIIKDWATFVQDSGINDPKKVSVLCKMKCRSHI